MTWIPQDDTHCYSEGKEYYLKLSAENINNILKLGYRYKSLLLEIVTNERREEKEMGSIILRINLLCTVTKPRPQKRSVPTATPVATTVGLGITTKSVTHWPLLTAPTVVPRTVLSAPSTSPVNVKEYTSLPV